MFYAEGAHINWCANGRGEIVLAMHCSSSSNVEWRSLPEQTHNKLVPRLDKIMLDFQALFDESADLEDYAHLPNSTLILCGDKSPAPSRRKEV